MAERILVVDDDETILRTLRINLSAHGFEVEAVRSGRDALESIGQQTPSVVVLDLGLPDLDGVEVLRRIRLTHSVPVIVLSARHQSDDKVEALDQGADDYVTKPFGMDELMARVRAAIRRGGTELEMLPPFVTADFTLNFATCNATRAGESVHLTPTEWRLLAALVRRADTVVPHDVLLKSAWGPSYGRESHYLRVYFNQLRRKLEPEPTTPKYLMTEPGIGYWLCTQHG